VNTPLPIEAHFTEIVDTVRRHQVTVIAGETGCGKTSRVPLMLIDDWSGNAGQIICTQPRRIAAMAVSAYAASLRGTELGTEIGYQIRHKNVSDERTTRVKYATEGILLREMRSDPLLSKYAVIILDEVHERGINQDTLMALMPELLAKRPELKLVLMSATLDEQRFAEAFNAPVIHIEGRTHPVRIEYAGSSSDIIRQAVSVTARALKETHGDVLVFMPDERHIRSTVSLLEERHPDLGIHALYGNQSPAEQRAVLDRTGRSVIVATNIAETSLTLDGLTAVVDSGLIKEMSYDPAWAASTFRVVPHARAGCDQRAGRAGRTQPGVCYRLYDEADFLQRPAYTVPEILRSSLEPVLLALKGIGLKDDAIRALPFLNRPSPALWDDARDRLILLGGITPDGRLTKDGERMSDIPLPPAVTRMVIAASDLGCVRAVATIAATFATRPIFVRPQGEEMEADAAHERFSVHTSDFLTTLKAVTAWRNAPDRAAFSTLHYLHQTALEEILDVEAQILAILEEDNVPVTDTRSVEAIGKSIAKGLIANLLMKDPDAKGYRGRRLKGIGIFRGSALYGRITPDYLVASGVIEAAQTYARGLHAVPAAWLPDIVPDDATLRAVPAFRFLKSAAKGVKSEKERRRDRYGRRRR
jgi:ATP-dependent helicase HrpA